MKKYFALSAVALTLVGCSAPEAAPDPASTVFNADGTVTFNYRNDSARRVQVDAPFSHGRRDMVKDSVTGLWSLTCGPVQPDLYPYLFCVDGVSIMDDQCQEWFPNEAFKHSLLDIPSHNEALMHDIKDVPHGYVDYINYYSKTLGRYNSALVYLPPSYATSPDKSYPVFYLISGTTDTEEVFYKVGRANVISDNLIAKGLAQEMIMVFPYGNPDREDDAPRQTEIWQDAFSRDMEQDLVPYIDANYRTIQDSDHRGVGGFSRGGNQAISYGLLHLDDFSYICSYSAFTSINLPKVYDHAKETNSKINLFWLGIGKDDFLYKNSHEYLEFLSTKGIQYIMQFTDGKYGHSWMNARYFFIHTLPLVFNKEDSKELMDLGMMVMPRLKGDERPFDVEVMQRYFPDLIKSPEINADGSVTFRFEGFDVRNVMLEGEMLDTPVAMTRDEKGIWSVTIKDIKPDVYCYNFIMDGTKVFDPVNMYLAPEIGFKRSILEFPDAPYAVNTGINKEDTKASLHYTATSIKYDENNAEYGEVVPQTSGSLPIICLLAGQKATFQAWQKVAHAQQILDHMIAAGQCKPCKLIMKNGTEPVSNASVTINADNYANWRERRQALVDALKTL